MFLRLFACFCFSFIISYQAQSAGDDNIYKTPLGKISPCGPNHVYLTETEEWGGQLDNLSDENSHTDSRGTITIDTWTSLKEYARNLGLTAFETRFVFSPDNDHLFTHPLFLSVLNDFRNVLKAAHRNKSMAFEGDIRDNEAYIAFSRIPETFSWDGGINVARRTLQNDQYAFAWKQDNNGISFIASPIALAELESQCTSIMLEKEDEALITITSGMTTLAVSAIDTVGIYNKYKSTLEKFLHKDKRRFINAGAHIALVDFYEDYLCNRPSIIDITDLSARARIYLLNKIIKFKAPHKKNVKRWKKEEKAIRGASSPGGMYEEWIDLIPTTFKIGNFSYKLECAATTQKPGGARIYGLKCPEIAETYAQVFIWLERQKTNLPAFKGVLKQRQKSSSICLNCESGQEAVSINQFLNGLSLLFDFEVARRRIKDDKFQELPILLTLPYLLTLVRD